MDFDIKCLKRLYFIASGKCCCETLYIFKNIIVNKAATVHLAVIIYGRNIGDHVSTNAPLG